MARASMRVIPFVLLFSLPLGGAHAALIEASSHVTEATIYTDRALVTRALKVHVTAGSHTISVADMPAGLNETTLRVQGKAGAAVKIGTVELKHIYLTELANAAERDKQAQIEAKENEKSLLQAEIDAAKVKEGFISRIADAGALKHDENGNAKLDFSPEKWQQAWNLVQTGMMETEKDLANRNSAMKKIDADITRLQQELNQVRSQQAKERRDAHVNVESSADTDLDLTLTYQTSGASWNPIYDARLDTNDVSLQLEQYGAVSQNTGEDWSDVALTLSTAQPASGSEMPHINEWWVRLLQPAYAALSAAPEGARLGSARPAAARNAPAAYDSSRDVEESPSAQSVDASMVTATAATTEYSAEFKVPGHVELKSTHDSSKLYLGEVKMKVSLAAQTTPRLSAQAYLFATSKNNETYPLIPGMVSKYRDGAFIGNANLPLVRPDEEAKFAFGVDDRIKVEYRHVKETQDNPALIVVGDVTVERQYQTKVLNLHKDPITITVLDQYPVSNDPDVKVSMLDDVTTPGFAQDPEKRQGVVAWTDSYKPKEEKTYGLGFRVKFPKGRAVQGL